MSPPLYEKVMIGKRTTCREHIPAPITMPEIEQKQVATLLTALTLSMLVSVYDQLPSHAAMARKKVEESARNWTDWKEWMQDYLP